MIFDDVVCDFVQYGCILAEPLVLVGEQVFGDLSECLHFDGALRVSLVVSNF